jgi:hypothetical protein
LVSLTRPDEDPSTDRHSQEAEQARADWQRRWEDGMLRQMDTVRSAVLQDTPQNLAFRCGGQPTSQGVQLRYWGQPVLISWPSLEALDLRSGQPFSLFDRLLLLYYLRAADGVPLEDRWVSFRELPGGAFYNQAFQGYSGDRMAKYFSPDPASFGQSARSLGGIHLTALGEYAYAFEPLPRLRLAGIFWPGDDEFPSRGMVLFDSSSLHYMVLDGLAILGARLVSKLEKNAPRKSAEG